MGTTTKMAIPYPEATGLVKDGWEDMKDIATQVDAKSGLVLLNTTSFSAVSSQSISDVFSTNYTNYRILINNVNASGGSLRMRLRVSGADDTNNNYITAYGVEQVGGATSTRVTDGATNSWAIVQSATTNDCSVSLDIYNPFASDKTYTSFFNMLRDGANYYVLFGGSVFTSSTSFTGFTLFTGTNSMTGSVSIFGYNK